MSDAGSGHDDDETLRIARDFGRAFDHVASVRPGDEALIARVVDRTLGAGNRRVVVRRWRIAAAVAAGVLLVAGGAGAYRAGVRIGPFARHTPAPAPEDRDGALPAPRRRAAAPRPAPIPPDPGERPAPATPDQGSEPIAAPVPRPLADRPPSARPTARPVIASPTSEQQPPAPVAPPAWSGASGGDVTAADLFRRAGSARRAGALAEAVALYGDLQARFPTAEEARLSHVSLGKLLLVMERPQEAEHHFTTYLAGGAGGLAAEAAVGRAQSFERMGRAREEREAWLGLLRDFPGSVYATAARNRIAALERSGGTDSAR